MIAPSLAQPGSSRQLVSFGRPVLARLAGRFACFLAAGALGTACHYLVLIALVELAALGAIVASSAGMLLGAFVNYVMNCHFVFRNRSATVEQSRASCPWRSPRSC